MSEIDTVKRGHIAGMGAGFVRDAIGSEGVHITARAYILQSLFPDSSPPVCSSFNWHRQSVSCFASLVLRRPKDLVAVCPFLPTGDGAECPDSWHNLR